MSFIKYLKNKKGQGMLEGAIIMPLIVLCIGMVITAGQLMIGKMTCQIAAYEGCRKAIVQKNYNNAQNIAKSKSSQTLKNGIGLTNHSYNLSNPSWRKGNLVSYTVKSNVKTLFPVLNTHFKTSTTTPVNGKITMMIENQ